MRTRVASWICSISSLCSSETAARAVAVVDERVEHERNLGMALGSRDDAPVQSRRPVVQADDCSVDAVDAAGVLEALGLSTEVC